MVKLLDLDDTGVPPTSFAAPPYFPFSKLKISEDSTASIVQDTRGIFKATTYYPVVSEIATFLDLTSLDQLSKTCKQIRSNLLQHKPSLITRTLRCHNDGLHRPCARDLVEACQRCAIIVCRNCVTKPMAANMLQGRHRRLCKICLKAPLDLHLISSEPGSRSTRNSHDDDYDDLDDDNDPEPTTFYHGPCSCVHQTWFCESCSRHQRSEDVKYMRGWDWRRRYSHTGVGIGEGEQGVACGRESRCLAVREVEVEIDADQFQQMTATTITADNDGGGGDGGNNGTRTRRRPWTNTSYQMQEIEGIGRVVKKKVKRRVNIGHVVKEYEDEREGGEYLHREKGGRVRSWCAHCDRVILSRDEEGAALSAAAAAGAAAGAGDGF